MKILITAGPTRELIDPVRFISNRSSGAIGVALAIAAMEAGHCVTLLLGPGPNNAQLPPYSPSFNVQRFTSASQLKQQLDAYFGDQDVLIMAAAVSDYRPVSIEEKKIRRQKEQPFLLYLEPTPDLVSQIADNKKPNQKIIAFALQDKTQLETVANKKLKQKGVDAVVGNPLETMESDLIEPLWLCPSGNPHAELSPETPGRMSKIDFAHWLIGRINQL